MRVVVIGSGIIGVSTAYFLAKSGAEVIVIDSATKIAEGGASFANAGMVSPSMADPWNAPGILKDMVKFLGKGDGPMKLHLKALPQVTTWGLKFINNSRVSRFKANLERVVDLSSYSAGVLRTLREELSLEYNQTTKGALKFFRNSDALAAAQSHIDVLARYGLDVELLDASDTVKKEPALSDIEDEIAGALFCHQDESGDSYAYTMALSELSRDLGVIYRMGETVTGFDVSGRRVHKVITDTEEYRVDRVVVAAGCWSSDILKDLKVSLPVRPVKGYSLTIPVMGWDQMPEIPLVDNCQHIAISPMGDRIRLGGIAEIAGYDSTLSESTIDKLYSSLNRVYPSFENHINRVESKSWTGLRPVSAYGVPHIGKTEFENLYLNTGHGPMGWTMGPGSGKLLADIVFEQKTGIEAGQFKPRS